MDGDASTGFPTAFRTDQPEQRRMASRNHDRAHRRGPNTSVHGDRLPEKALVPSGLAVGKKVDHIVKSDVFFPELFQPVGEEFT